MKNEPDGIPRRLPSGMEIYMKIIRSLEFHPGSKEEKLPYDSPDFPYIASRAELDLYREPFVPWHWHNAIELFYMESGELTYETPHKTLVFPAGSAGMVNANVLHKTWFEKKAEAHVQLLHIFDPLLLAGNRGSLIDQKYISPIVADSRIEVIALFLEEPAQAKTIGMIREAFLLSEKEPGYEFRIREALSEIWIRLFEMCAPLLKEKPQGWDKTTDKVKEMMVYIHEHYAEKISVRELAAAAFLSERECYRVFRDHLHMTPVDYIKSYRIQIACRMLAEGRMPITEVGIACGMENSSYFGKVFRESTGDTPRQYRCKWQDKNKN